MVPAWQSESVILHSCPQSVIERERRGDYLGKTVQVVPHITDAIQDWIGRVAHIAVDGRDGPRTVGDIESMPFIEALRQVKPSVLGSLLNITFLRPTSISVQQIGAPGLSANLTGLTLHMERYLEQWKMTQSCGCYAVSIQSGAWKFLLRAREPGACAGSSWRAEDKAHAAQCCSAPVPGPQPSPACLPIPGPSFSRRQR